MIRPATLAAFCLGALVTPLAHALTFRVLDANPLEPLPAPPWRKP